MIRLAELLAANPDARLLSPARAPEGQAFSGFAFDSRILEPGQLFMAVRTARADGHDHIPAALRAGAAGVLCQRAEGFAAPPGVCVIQVPDTVAAVQRYARGLVARRGLPVVAVTGSAGKTSVKEFIAHVLAARLSVFRNPGNFNDSYGLPIALGLLEDGHEVLVLEMGTDRRGEIAELAAIAPPDTAVVTLVAPAHLDALGDLDGVAREKGSLVRALGPGGLAVLNGDDPRVAAMADLTAAAVVCCHVDTALMPVTTSDGAAVEPDRRESVWAEEVTVGREGTAFRLHMGGESAAVRIPRLGAHFARAALMAAAVGRHYGLGLAEICARLEDLPAVPGRLNPLPGRGGSLLLDDSYNASPEAVLAGLEVLRQLPAGRRVAILGDMAELGDLSAASHRQVGQAAAAVADLLITKGRLAEGIAAAAREAGMPADRVSVTGTAEDAVDAALPSLDAGTVAFIKGSAVSRMEQVVAGLLAQPARARELLVRQDRAWRQIAVLQPDRPTWLEIDLGALAHNTRQLTTAAGGAELMAVLKADGYGHGAVQAARVVLRHGASRLAVACLPEAAALRAAGIAAPILILGHTPAWQAREALRLDLSATVFDLDAALAFSQAARDLGRTATVHLKVDTGMHRLGCAPREALGLMRAMAAMPRLRVEGVFSHLASADEAGAEGRALTEAQLAGWAAVLAELDEEGLRPPLFHIANSAGLLAWPQAPGNLVRPGIALFGLSPGPDLAAAIAAPALDLRPVLAWKTQIAQVRELSPGEPVGYGASWRAERASRVATIPVGYADGFRRSPSRWREALVRGQAAPLVGRVSMDQSAIDVTAIPGARQGDEVVLIGRQGEAAILAETAAEWLGTISYEVVSGILARVPRLQTEGRRAADTEA